MSLPPAAAAWLLLLVFVPTITVMGWWCWWGLLPLLLVRPVEVVPPSILGFLSSGAFPTFH